MLKIVLLSVVLGLPLSPSAWAGQLCPGDANDDGRVTVAELVQAIRNALDGCPSSPCNADADGDGSVTVAELVLAVNQALVGCNVGDSLVADVEWLQEHRSSPRIQLVDARVGSFEGGHIPGALPLNPYAIAREVDGVAAQMMDGRDAAGILSWNGLREDAIAVVYGVSPEFDPARVVWALRYLGHRRVRYLDGGWDAWVAAGGEVAAGNPVGALPRTQYPFDRVRDELRVDGAWILDRLGEPPYENPEIQIVDARSPAEYQNGFIPSAVPRQWTINLEDGELLPPDQLEPIYSQLDKSRTTVVYCLAGWRASVAWLVLTEIGFEDVRVYDGSWFEWGDSTRGFPIATPPPFDPSDVKAECRLANKGGPGASDSDRIIVRLAVLNDSTATITDVTPGELSPSDASVDLDAIPTARRIIPERASALFVWEFDLSGTVAVTVGVSATGPDGEFTIGPVDCGMITGGD